MKIIQPSRRGFITGLASLIVAPAIVRVESLMSVKAVRQLTIEEFNDLVMKPMMDKLTNYVADNVMATRIDILYGKLVIHPLWAKDIFIND